MCSFETMTESSCIKFAGSLLLELLKLKTSESWFIWSLTSDFVKIRLIPLTITPTMRPELSSTEVIIAGTVGTFDGEVDLLIKTFGLAYVRKAQHPIVELTDKDNRCSVCLRAKRISILQLQALMFKIEELHDQVLKRTEEKSQIELQIWYRFAPLEGLPGNSINFVDLPYSISSKKQKDEAFRIHCILNQHRLMIAFHSAPGKYVRIFVDPYQLQKVTLELRQKQLAIPDELALQAARFHIIGVKSSQEIFAWKVTAPSNTSDVSLQITFQDCTWNPQEIQEYLKQIALPVQYQGIVHVQIGDEVIVPAAHVVAHASIADMLVHNQYLDLPCGRATVQLLQEVVDAPKWVSKPINHISENPREHFLNCHSGNDKVGQGRLIHVRARDEYQPVTKQRMASIVWHKDDLETHFFILDKQAPYVVMTGKCEDIPELQKLQSLQAFLRQNSIFQDWVIPDHLPKVCQNDEDFTAEQGIIQYLLVRIVGKTELEIPLILRNGHHLVCHPGTSVNSNVILSLHQGALLFLPRCHSCDILKLIEAKPSDIYAFDLCAKSNPKADLKVGHNSTPPINNRKSDQQDVSIEQSDTAQRPTLLTSATVCHAGTGSESQDKKIQEAQSLAKGAESSNKRGNEADKGQLETVRRRNTSLRFQPEVPANVQEQVQRCIAGLYCPVAAAYRIIASAQWSKENSQHYAPFPKQAALVLAAMGYNVGETARAKLDHILGQVYLDLANNTPLESLELQSFTDVYAKAIAAIPANTQFSLLLQIECKCSRCQQPQPVVALPLLSEQDSSEQHSILPDLGQLVDLAISYLQQNLSPRTEVCKLEIKRLPSFFCILTHKVQRSAFKQVCKAEDDVRKVQHLYNVLAIVLHDPKAKHTTWCCIMLKNTAENLFCSMTRSMGSEKKTFGLS